MKTTDMFSGTSVRHPDNGTENCLAIGTRLSDFEITGILGEGGFGIVYVAFDHALQRTVAIKEYMPGALAARGADQSVTVRAERHQETFDVGLRSFINEARFLAQFDHPSLVKVYRFWEQNRTAYTAMQYYDGRTVKNIVENSPELVTDAWCRLIFKQILEALEMLYTMNILHRDVSPDNIMVQASGDAVLLDFGSARQIIGDMTRGLTVILKPGYAPIEQYAGDASLEQGAWTDIYALSALMYFAIVREAPPTSIARMVKDPLTPLQGRALPGFSPQLLAAIDKGLAVLAQDRPQSIDELRALLGIEAAAAPRRSSGSTQRVAPAEPVPVAPAPPRAKARWAVGAAVGVLALAGLGLYAVSGGPDPVMVVQQQPDPPPVQEVVLPEPALDAEALAWGKLEDNAQASLQQLGEFVQQYPAGKYAAPAKARLGELQAKAQAALAAAPANYKLLVKPWGTVYVDGKERGVSPPLKTLVLAPGKHEIRIVNPAFPDHVMTIDIAKQKSGKITHDFSATPK